MYRILLPILFLVPFISFAQQKQLSSQLNIQHQRVVTEAKANLQIARYGFGHTTDDRHIYVANGSTGKAQYLSVIERYDTETDKWDIISTMATPKRYGSLEYLKGKLYLFNGERKDTVNDRLEIFDLKTGEFSKGTTPPSPTRSGGSVNWKGSIYSFGGRLNTKDFSTQLLRYDPSSDSWTTLSPMKIARETKGAIVEGKLYVIGGFNGKSLNSIEVYDIEKEQWTDFIELPITISAHAITVDRDRIWIVGDYNNLSFLASYDPTSRGFTVYNSKREGTRHAGCAFINNSLYAFGGNTNPWSKSATNAMQLILLVP